MIARRELTINEWNSLVGIYQHEIDSVAVDVGKHLSELGLIEQAPGRTDLSVLGKRLVGDELLAERRNRLQNERH
ncbi:hypothetical protein [Rhizobium sp. BK376]|uniref:hypothetical protein n=1 Tax=Rhizobium sp. BK376 TaxID=2512149 RepID=UPI00105008A1|nr:hypothetical protein [Rhizobium sp. BK376]TCR64506.1 hypothetical protein EV561_1644 [Rhizobium sp. BK376]